MDIYGIMHGAPWKYVEDHAASSSLKRTGHVYQIVNRLGELCPDYHPAPHTVHYQEMAAYQIVQQYNERAAQLMMTVGTKAEGL